MPKSDALLYARHLEQRAARIDEILGELGYDGLLIHSGRPENRLFDDQHPPFRAHGPFVSLAPLPFVADSLLELRVGSRPRLWYCQPDDFWHMPPEPPPGWLSDSLDIEIVRSPSAWEPCFAQQRALAVIGEPSALGDLLDGADLNPPELLWRLDEMRTRKTAFERSCIERANRLAVAGHLAAAETFQRGASELEIHLAYLAAMGMDQDTLPYNSIVALNDHAAVLHYQYRSVRQPQARHSFLIDAGADWRGYAADITRSWTLDTHREFGALIEAMDSAQLRLVDQVRAGADFVELHLAAHRAVAAVLEQAGIVRMAPEDQVETGVSGHFLPHGLGHFLGVQVHDVAGLKDATGQPMPPPSRFPALRLTRRLEVGNVVTIEPGLYFIPSFMDRLRASEHASCVDWQAIERLIPYGGIRIEDNVLVSEAEPINFTRQAFYDLQR